MKTKIKKKYIILAVILIICFIWSSPVIFHWNKGESVSSGSVGNGSLKNPYKMDLYGKNFSYFSYLSYFGLGMCFTNSKVYHSIKAAMKSLETSCPGKHFYIMELSRKNGGKTLLHKSHYAGLSADFMVPKKTKTDKQSLLFDRLGLWHYLYNFDKEGRLNLNKSVMIDFESLAALIYELKIASSKNRIKLLRVIIRDEIKDNLLRTKFGPQISNVVVSFPGNKFVNVMHDDHIHVDFY